jgi:4-hydroxy-tetrahydrodipicolinate reductase
MVNIGIAGASGKLGREVEAIASELGCAVTLWASSSRWTISTPPAVMIDVSHASGFADIVEFCSCRQIPLVEGVSTLAAEDIAQLQRLSETVPVLHGPNFAFGHHLQRLALETLARALTANYPDWECTISERHCTSKRDRPSATARVLANVWQCFSGREATDIASVRGGLPVSDHEFNLTGDGELLTIKHSVSSRKASARGALLASRWLVVRPPGFYQMSDVFDSPCDAVQHSDIVVPGSLTTR